MSKPIIKIADGAYFVASYSTQTILRSYDTSTTVQELTAAEPAEADTSNDQSFEEEKLI
jgi:hypothetical protein